MKNEILIAITLGLPLLCACAGNSPERPIPSECSAGERIWYEFIEDIPSQLNEKQARAAVIESLQKSGDPSNQADSSSAGDWRYEYSEASAIYAGLTVRSHYLRVAITFNSGAVESIVCDSRNLAQSGWSIHRYVPTWKAALDDNIRIALRQAAEQYGDPSFEVSNDTISIQMNYLNALYKSGILTAEEYEEMSERVTDN